MGRRLPFFLALAVALFVGVVPLRNCLAQDTGGQGVVALGAHSHHGHADGSGCAHDGDSDSDADHDADHDADACCVDSPFHAVVSVDVVSADRSLNSPVTVLALLAATSLDPELSSAAWAHTPAPPEVREPVPTGLVSTVLLR